jgi:hypothetical protein
VKIFLFRLLVIVILNYIVVTARKIFAFVMSFYIGLINIFHFSSVSYVYILQIDMVFESCLIGPRIKMILGKVFTQAVRLRKESAVQYDSSV